MVTAKDILKKEFIKVDQNDTVSRLIAEMKNNKDTYALVFDGKKYIGYADKKWLAKSRFDAQHMKIKHCINHVPKLSPDSELNDMVKLMATSDTRALPVIEQEKVIGIVRAKDLCQQLVSHYDDVPVTELASMKLMTFLDTEEIGRVQSALKKKNLYRAPIVDKKGDLVGIVSIRDIQEKFNVLARCSGQRISKSASHQMGRHTGYGTGEKTSLSECPISNEMETNCITASPKAMVSDILKIMADNDVSSVILVEKNKPVGILTSKDILEDFADFHLRR